MAETSDEKRHAACDECRSKKLKCSGETSGCKRCVREALACNYSIRAPMGRPPKRRRGPDEQEAPKPDERANARNDTSTAPPFDFGTDGFDPNDLSFLDGMDQPLDFQIDDVYAGTLFDDLEAPLSSFAPASHPDPSGPATAAQDAYPGPSSDLPSNSTQPQCFCLPSMLSATTGLDANRGLVGFPMALSPLKKALIQAQNIMTCSACTTPHNPISAWRINTLYMITLLGSIACKFDELLRTVALKATELENSNTKKTMRLGEQSSHHTAHLHTGTSDCPMGFEMEFGAAEWRAMAFRAIKAEVSQSDENKATLINLVARLEMRQRLIHALKDGPDSSASNAHSEKSPTCVQLTKSIWDTIRGLPD